MSHPRTLSLTVAALATALALTACSGNRAEIDAACADIQSTISGVNSAAESIRQDILVDDVPYQEQHADELYEHLVDVERLEEAARGSVRDDAADRADAVNAVLEELEVGDYNSLESALNWTADTHGIILEACGY